MGKFIWVLFHIFSIAGLIAIPSLVLFKPDFLTKHMDRLGPKGPRRFIICVSVLAVFVGFIVNYMGMYRVLNFVPGSWGGLDEDGNWESSRSQLTALLSGCLSLLEVTIIMGYNDLQKGLRSSEVKLNRLLDIYAAKTGVSLSEIRAELSNLPMPEKSAYVGKKTS